MALHEDRDDLRRVVDRRDAVLEDRRRAHHPVPVGLLLQHRLAHAHVDAALDLAGGDLGVQGAAQVVRAPDPLHGDDAALLVHGDLCDLCGEAVRRRGTDGGAPVAAADVGRPVGARRAQGAVAGLGELDGLCPAELPAVPAPGSRRPGR